jgi:transglutaminase-like putative cysteine protease
MKPLRRVRLELLVLAEIAIAAFCVSQRSIGMFLLAGGLGALSWYVTQGPRGRTLPRWAANVLTVLIFAESGWSWLINPDPSEAMTLLGRFAMWLSVLKLYERRSPRDDAQLLALSAVLVVAGALHTVDLLFAILLLIYGIGTIRVAMLLQLVSTQREGSTDGTERVAGRRFPSQLRRTVALTAIGSTLLAMVVFVVFPRRLEADPRRGGVTGTPVSGFAEEVDLFAGERISESRREVFSVRWLDRAGESVRFPQPLLLRGSVMSDYVPETSRWTSSSSRSRMRTVTVRPDLAMTPLSLPPVRPRSETYRQQVVMRSMATDTVFAAFAPIGLSAPDRRSFGIDLSTLIVREIGIERLSRLQSYEVQIEPFPGPETLEPLLGEIGARIPPLPDFPVAGIREIAESILAERSGDPDLADLPDEAAAAADPEVRWDRNRRISRVLLAWLRDEGRFFYTTDLGEFVRFDGEDPIESFLVRHRFGHCEYFASALAALCRSVGVDARLVTGFIAMEWDEGLAHYVVRESNAHAWVEVRTGRYLWNALDPTPGSDLEALAASRRSWLDEWRWIYDRIELFWNSRIVSYDGAVQASLADRVARGWSDAAEEAIESATERLRETTRQFELGAAALPWVGAILLGVATAIAAATLAIGRRRRLRREAALPSGAGRRLLAIAEIHLEAMRLWSRAGWDRPHWEPPRRFLASLPRELDDAVTHTRAIVDLYYRARFGEREAGTVELRRATLRLRLLRRRLSVRGQGVSVAS